MKFKVYRNNPVNVNLGYIPVGDTTLDFLEEVELNFRYNTPTSITVFSDTPFYYAIDSNNNAWRTTDIQYVTNTKVNITMVSQSLKMFKEDTSVRVTGDIGLTSAVVGTTEYNKLLSTPSSILLENNNKLLINTIDLIDDFEEVCIIQTSDVIKFDLNIGSVSITESYEVGEIDWDDFPEWSAPAYQDYSNVDSNIKGAIGVNTYIIRAQDLINGTFKDVSLMLVEFMRENTSFINARIVRLPTNYFSQSGGYNWKVRLKDTDSNLFTINALREYKPLLTVLDTIPASYTFLEGRKAWKIGENLMYPNIDDSGASTLKFIMVIGVGTCFGIFFTGLYEDLINNPQSVVVLELGYNLSPNTINPSIYYNNRQYQGLVNSQPAITGVAGVVGSIASMALLPKTSLIARGVLGVAGALNTISSVNRGNAQLKQEQHNYSTINNVNDVQDIGKYIAINKQVCRVEVIEQSNNIFILNALLNTYTPHYAQRYISRNTLPSILKCSQIANEINTNLYTEGCIPVTNDELELFLNNANI